MNVRVMFTPFLPPVHSLKIKMAWANVARVACMVHSEG
jgi:hypothetical protein